jgi:hypothetical protein
MSEKKAPADVDMIDTTAPVAKDAKVEEKKEEVYDPFFGNIPINPYFINRVQEGHGAS